MYERKHTIATWHKTRRITVSRHGARNTRAEIPALTAANNRGQRTGERKQLKTRTTNYCPRRTRDNRARCRALHRRDKGDNISEWANQTNFRTGVQTLLTKLYILNNGPCRG